MPIRLVLIDDHPIVLDRLAALFRLHHDLEVVARCTTAEAGLEAIRTLGPDVVVLDLRLPGKNGLTVLADIRREKIVVRTVLLAGDLHEDEALAALRLGVHGIVLKEMASELLVKCVRKVSAGEQWLEKRSTGHVMDKFLRQETTAKALSVLTPKEVAVVQLVTRGCRNKEIADRLQIAEGTVKMHLHHIYAKLEVDGRLALSVLARDKGLA